MLLLLPAPQFACIKRCVIRPKALIHEFLVLWKPSRLLSTLHLVCLLICRAPFPQQQQARQSTLHSRHQTGAHTLTFRRLKRNSGISMALLQQQQRLAASQRQRAAAPCVLRSTRTLLRPLAAAAPTKAGLIDGKKIAEDIRKEIAAEVQQLQKAAGRAPGLAVVLVGARKDSETYVRSKKKACAEVGFESFGTDLPEDVSQEELLKVVAQYNADPKVWM
jgi:hypothetical protein